MNLLRVADLSVTYTVHPPVAAVEGVSLTLARGECLAIVGESGSGKSSIGRALLGLVPEAVLSGTIHFDGDIVDTMDQARMRDLRWRRIGIVFQSTSALNPVLTIGDQIDEPQRLRMGRSAAEAAEVTGLKLKAVGLDPNLFDRYPGELSGGQRRLAAIALALAGEPDLLILDEPTAGLDPDARIRVSELLAEMRSAGTAMVLLSHDLDTVSTVADRVLVLYRGWMAECGDAATVLSDPAHPYTAGLVSSRPTLASVKDLRGIRGDPPDPSARPTGCPFAERCTQVIGDCRSSRPMLQPTTGGADDRLVSCIRGGLVTVLRAIGVRKSYRVGSSGLRRRSITAIAGVDLDVREGEVVGLAGANGAGKSTLVRMLARITEPDHGQIEFEGSLLGDLSSDDMAVRRRLQLLFQDPYEALSPRLTIAEAVREPLDIQKIGTPDQRSDRVREMMGRVRLPTNDTFLGRHTHQLSGGQLQRVGLARALVLAPKLLVADEPLAGLDPSEQAKMLQLLKHLQVELGMAMILVSHDLAVLVRAADRIYVLDQGRVVEEAPGTRLMFDPSHDVTRRLLSASGRDHLLGAR